MSLFAKAKTFLGELKRRKVFHVGSIYLVTAWGASLGAAELFPAFGVPDWGVRAFVITAGLGLPIALVLAWAFEITPEGVVLDPGREEANEDGHYPRVPLQQQSTTTWLQAECVSVRWQLDGRDVVKEFNKSFVLGRDPDADVQLRDNKVSRLHAKVLHDEGRWWIRDLSSRNGTLLNGVKLTEPTVLEDTNEVLLYDGATPIVLVVRDLSAETVLDG